MARWDYNMSEVDVPDNYLIGDKYEPFHGDTTKEEAVVQADGGPAEYYDFPAGAITLNDLIEHKDMSFHLGNIFKACWRYGTKAGTSKEYDARKIIYSGARILMKLVGVDELRKTLTKMLDDPQFSYKDK